MNNRTKHNARVTIIGCGGAGSFLAGAISSLETGGRADSLENGTGPPASPPPLRFSLAGVADRDEGRSAALSGALGCRDFGRDAGRAAREGNLVVLAVPDCAISALCGEIAGQGAFEPGQMVCHLSGAHGSDLLAAAARARARCISLHPATSMAGFGITPGEERFSEHRFDGVHFVFEGDPRARSTIRKLVEALGGVFHEVDPELKPLYHSACVLSSNFLVTLLSLSSEMLSGIWAEGAEGEELICSLLGFTLENISRCGRDSALTGPVVRGDLDTVRMNLEAFGRVFPNYRRLYLELLELTVAREKISAPIRERILKFLESEMNPA